ncbi:uncharacterized protein L201_002140 [Kwoniella dendrophila CBS 6074]|uniref:Apple domain-containing protein n=1 Tax=Kwoniella dendrophila CBS 6074 TaxID=1295534 RepID=A0AAX4JRC4_9TREE
MLFKLSTILSLSVTAMTVSASIVALHQATRSEILARQKELATRSSSTVPWAVYKNVGYSGGSSYDYVDNVESYQACNQLCQDNANCKNANFYDDSGTCGLATTNDYFGHYAPEHLAVRNADCNTIPPSTYGNAADVYCCIEFRSS